MKSVVEIYEKRSLVEQEEFKLTPALFFSHYLRQKWKHRLYMYVKSQPQCQITKTLLT